MYGIIGKIIATDGKCEELIQNSFVHLNWNAWMFELYRCRRQPG